MSAKRFYVYVLARPDGRPFYVGKGQGGRIYDHERYARAGHPGYKSRIIRKIWKHGQEIQRYVVFETDDEHEAFAYERETITFYGRENLCNHTDGGEGPSGIVPSPEALRNRAAGMKKRWSDPEYKARLTTTIQAFAQTPEFRAKISAITRERLQQPEVRANMSRITTALWQDPTHRAKVAATTQERWQDPANRTARAIRQQEITRRPEVRAKMSIASKEHWQDSEYRATHKAAMEAAHDKVSAAAKARWTDEYRAKQSAWKKEYMQRPEVREWNKAKALQHWQDPEYRAKINATWTPERRAEQAERMRERQARKKAQE